MSDISKSWLSLTYSEHSFFPGLPRVWPGLWALVWPVGGRFWCREVHVYPGPLPCLSKLLAVQGCPSQPRGGQGPTETWCTRGPQGTGSPKDKLYQLPVQTNGGWGHKWRAVHTKNDSYNYRQIDITLIDMNDNVHTATIATCSTLLLGSLLNDKRLTGNQNPCNFRR